MINFVSVVHFDIVDGTCFKYFCGKSITVFGDNIGTRQGTDEDGKNVDGKVVNQIFNGDIYQFRRGTLVLSFNNSFNYQDWFYGDFLFKGAISASTNHFINDASVTVAYTLGRIYYFKKGR